MFESLKSKLKNVFNKSSKKLDSEEIYEKDGSLAVERSREFTSETKKSSEVSEPTIETISETVPVHAETVKEEKLSRKEHLKLAKQKKVEKKSAKTDRFSTEDMVGDSGKKIKEDPLDDLLDELELILLESDVAYPVVQEIIIGVRDNLVNKKYAREYTLEEVVETAVKEAVRKVLLVNEFNFDEWIKTQKKPIVIMFIGINGTGKTTAIAKIAKRLQDNGNSIVLAACDTFRAGAIEQLSIHANNLGIKIVKQIQDADPAAVAFDALEHANSKKKDVVLIDTAGRMQTNNNLIDEMKKIARISKPALKIFVGDSLAGNDAIEQAKVFDAAVGIDAVILTKIDTDAKGGAALSIAHTIGKPIAFVCNGQEYDDIQPFNADWMLDRIFDSE
ncbi:MAG: signal recognition particle-docking protein FtsY [Candidatus Methanomethylophilaceae archaeon]|nr:signal recognition particle-docking protein FtsY [Candidatus Methanomethylophilaceae archaeon]MDD3378749.1 signal recognition particle-docking protein FtsY [Candidatus Methanomethylophilaceae archaeon]MDY0223782.1 signal recognition particle-docking protein FtsY [Candidatus Methanomethylophilaceae archaeon]